MDPEYTNRLLEKVRNASLSAAETAEPTLSLHAAYNAVIQGDYAAFAALVTDDVQLNIHGFAPMDGEWRGREAVLEAMQRNFALVENQQPQVEQMISQDNAVVLLLRERGVLKSDGRRYDVRCVQWFQFAGGKIQSIDEIVASEPVTV